ncbi:MAG: UDP-N-acetylmuramoyl-tripeptide--D-alanyl-D-alanine ligase [candidate division WOR-3 bacterium]
MERLTVAEIARATQGRVVEGAPEASVIGVSIDSRTIKPGEIYIAIRGKRFDGHQFVLDAVKNGAVAVMIEKGQGSGGGQGFPTSTCSVIEVDDTKRALLGLARWYRSLLKVKVVAVTGSNGKTTTKEMLASILSQRFRVVKARQSFNNEIGVPLTVFEMDRTTDLGIFEIEMNEFGGTKRLAEVCRPEVGIITNIGDTHLEFMKDRQGVAKEKRELLEALPENGVAVVNFDDPLVMAMVHSLGFKNYITFGLGEGAAVFATDTKEKGILGSEFVFMGRHPVRLRVLGKHNIYNFLAAAAAARSLGLKDEEIVAGVDKLCLPPQRLTVKRLAGVLLIDDCFNANPQSMQSALEVLRATAPKESRVAILGDMLELGEESRRLHYELGVVAAEIADRLVVVGKEAEFVASGALSQGMDQKRLKRYPRSDAVGDDLFDILRAGDTILVKGSRQMALEIVTEKIVRYYGEKTD